MITLAKPIATADLVRAIELACSPVRGALDMCNALGGSQSDAWDLVRGFTLAQLLDEAVEREIDLDVLKAACCDMLVVDTPPFHGAIGYDPRPRCGLCGRRHFVDKRVNEPLSCGRTQSFFNPPEWRWTKATAVAAVEG